jgi:hypothetical protein
MERSKTKTGFCLPHLRVGGFDSSFGVLGKGGGGGGTNWSHPQAVGMGVRQERNRVRGGVGGGY